MLDLISKLAQNPDFLSKICLNLLLALFVVCFLWITCRVIAYWLGVVLCRYKIKETMKKNDDLRSVRRVVETSVDKYLAWAGGGFRDYRTAWEESRLPEDDKAILPIRIREYLTPENVLDNVRNRRLAEALPGIFVALGIFGTFLGLLIGLDGLEVGKLDNLKNGVGQLISGLSLAFRTSLAGIVLSIAFSLSYRFAINQLERSFLALDTLLCTVYPFDSQERYARRYFQVQTDIKQGLQTLATDVATQVSGAIGPKLGEALESHLVPVMQNLNEWIEKHIEENKQQQSSIVEGFDEHLTRLSKVISQHFQDSQSRQSEAMEAVLQHYSAQLTDTFQNQFETMGRVIAQTTQAQQEIKQHLVDFGDQLQRQFQSQGELIEKTTRAGEILSSSLEGLESIAQKLKHSADDISSAAELLEQSATSALEGQVALRETMTRQITTMAETRKELESTWRDITESSAGLVDQIRQTVDELTAGVGENLVKALDSFDGKMAEVVERFSGTLFEARQTISEMPQLVISMNESLQAIDAGINDQKGILDEIKETSTGLVAGNIEMACNVSKQLGLNADKIAATTTSMNAFFEQFSDKFIESANAFEKNNREAIGDLNRIINELIIELRQGQSILRDSKVPSNNAVQQLSPPRDDGGSNGDENSVKSHILTLGEQIAHLAAAIEKPTDKKNGDLNKDLLEKMTAIEHRIQTLSPGLKHAMARLANVDNAVSKIANAQEQRLPAPDSRNVSEKKRSLFGFGGRN